jgi:hypothetical protein
MSETLITLILTEAEMRVLEEALCKEMEHLSMMVRCRKREADRTDLRAAYSLKAKLYPTG